MESIRIKVDQPMTSWGPQWYAFNADQGIDYDWTGDGWKRCGSPIGTGNSIQEAIDNLIEILSEDQDEVSDCCGALPRGNGDNDTKDFGICPDCHDHCEYVTEELTYSWS